jgi:alanine-glyoxylate transaminase/serine-glyoxylate transaminase/serine-pyruvate transaminase
MDPYLFNIMDDIMKLLRYLFRTGNELTFPLSATGSAGMDASFGNFLERGDTAVIGANGYFGERMVAMALRYGANVVRLDAEWGRIIEPEVIEAALRSQKQVKLLALVHAETSTGVLQPLTEASQLARQYGALFLVDAVTSLGGQELVVDGWGIDICYSGSQKCISCPPGLAPITVNQRARDTLKTRTCDVSSFYLDLSLLAKYWLANGARTYHHTAPACMLYALHEALVLLAEEGLEASIGRHRRNGASLQAGLEAMGLELHAQPGHRLTTLTSVHIPPGVDDLRVRQRLLHEKGIEIGRRLGDLKGRIWRIGLMGHSSSAENVLGVLSTLEKLLADEGYTVEPGASQAAAQERLSTV